MCLEEIRNEALRKLGRNIVNFSKIEAGFKYLLSLIILEGKEKTLSEQLCQNQTRLQKQTLGTLVQEFNKSVLTNSSKHKNTSSFSTEGISISFKIDYDDPNFLKEQKLELAKIVAERNKLIHQDLAFLDTSSVEDYRNLITLLDEQNPRLLAILEEQKWMIESFQDLLQDLLQNLLHSTQSQSNS